MKITASSLKPWTVLLLLGWFCGCSSVSTYESAPMRVASGEKVYLRLAKDPDQFAANVSARIRRLGFQTTTQPQNADYYADVHYSTYFDVVHLTFNHFEITFVDAKTGKGRVRSRYNGAFGFNNCNAALNMVFRDLAKKIQSR